MDNRTKTGLLSSDKSKDLALSINVPFYQFAYFAKTLLVYSLTFVLPIWVKSLSLLLKNWMKILLSISVLSRLMWQLHCCALLININLLLHTQGILSSTSDRRIRCEEISVLPMNFVQFNLRLQNILKVKKCKTIKSHHLVGQFSTPEWSNSIASGVVQHVALLPCLPMYIVHIHIFMQKKIDNHVL